MGEVNLSRPLKSLAATIPNSFIDGDWIEAPYLTEQGVRLIQTGNIGVGQFLDKSDVRKYVSERTVRVLGCKEVRAGDILICRLAEPIGRACVVPTIIDRAITAVDCTIFRPDPGKLDTRYALHFLNSERWLKSAADLAGGSTRQRISRDNLGRLAVHVPSLSEQRRIAEILDEVDSKINNLRLLIEKQKITALSVLNAELTKRKSDSTFLLDSLLANTFAPLRSGPFGSELLKTELTTSGIPLLGIDNIQRERFIPKYSRFVSPRKVCALKRYRVYPLDVMVTIMGTVGRCAVVPLDIGMALSSKHTWVFSLNQTRVDPFIMCAQINHSPWCLGHIDKDQQGGIMSAIRSSTLRTMPIVAPDKSKISGLIYFYRSSLDQELVMEKTLSKLLYFKQGVVDAVLGVRSA